MTADVGKIRHYDSVDGLKAYASVGIVIMHVLINGQYELDGFVFRRLIPEFTDLVFLFMMVSGFSLCCGYFDKMVSGQVTPAQFYSRRISRIWPFFAFVTVLDLIVSPSIEAVYEAFANLTLCFALLPNPQISVIGVGWTVGVIFVFYLIFPFFCYLLSNPKRAWLSFGTAFVFHLLCIGYFLDENHMPPLFSGRVNIIYCFVYFMAGGMIFLYREKLASAACRFRYLIPVLLLVAGAVFFLLDGMMPAVLLLFSLMLIGALSCSSRKGVLNNPVTAFLSRYSMEIYLCHMMVFRILEKLHLTEISSLPILDYIITVTMILLGAIAVAAAFHWAMPVLTHWLKRFWKAGGEHV